MLKLKNVSKFYYSKGVIASGFSKVNLELNMGEFVVITGESGSGKSTLLNVLSGLDTYEEGEMYINGEETSHYNEADFEEYRRKYVGNIFQNFNLVNSYTVYQNIELALLLNGEKKEEIKNKIDDIIEKVGLTDFAKTKCAKLSGGQKQRVAIARALAKETPIIVADEPTGNLDSESATDVIQLLSEIAKDKLVIIVTHNLEQVEHHATRLIKMHDGKILEDKIVKENNVKDEGQSHSYADITAGNRLRLGMRNAFNIPTKFALIFAVFLLIAFSVAGTYSSFQQAEYEESIYGWNQYFNDTSDNRIVINKADKSEITGEEFTKIEALSNVKNVVKDDTFVDFTQSLTDEDYWYYFYGNFAPLDTFDGELAYGRMPENDNEIIIEGSQYEYDLSNNYEEVLGTEFYLDYYDYSGNLIKEDSIKVVGISMRTDYSGWLCKFYVSDQFAEVISEKAAQSRSNIILKFNDYEFNPSEGDTYFNIVPSDKVPQGKAYVSTQLNDYADYGNCVGKNLEITSKDIYRTETINLTIASTYTKWNFEKLLGEEFDPNTDGLVYINDVDYKNLIDGGYFQSTVYVKDVKALDSTAAELEELGFKTLVLRDAMSDDSGEIKQLVSMMKTFVLVGLIIALFFISYFIIKIVLKSRNAYYTTIRTLGGSKKISKQLLDIELFVIATLAYGVFMGIIAIIKTGVVKIEMLVEMVSYLTTGNYVLMYVITILLAYMISTRFARNIFEKSVMSTYREEV